MTSKDFSRGRGLCCIVFILALVMMHPVNLAAQRRHQEKLLKVEVKGDLVTMDVRNTDVSDVLKEIAKGSGIKITFSPELLGQSIYFLKFADMSIDWALRVIWNEFNSYCIYTLAQDPANREKQIIKEIKVYGDIIGTKPYKGKIAVIEIPYGDGEQEVGLISLREGLPTGPGSFAVDEAGNIFICDTVRQGFRYSHPRECIFMLSLYRDIRSIKVQRPGSILGLCQ